MDSRKVRGLKRLESLLQNQEFVNELGRLHDLPDSDLSKEDEGELGAGIYSLISKHKLLQSHFPILERLVAGDSLDTALKVLPDHVARIIDHNNKTITPSDSPETEYQIAETISNFKSGVVIQINSDISKDELVEFVKRHYSKFIRPALTKRKTLSYERKAKRNNKIRKDKLDGKPIAEIEVDENINQSRVYKILKQK
jgi:hypothetical protein